jgi:hypothetical protein
MRVQIWVVVLSVLMYQTTAKSPVARLYETPMYLSATIWYRINGTLALSQPLQLGQFANLSSRFDMKLRICDLHGLSLGAEYRHSIILSL